MDAYEPSVEDVLADKKRATDYLRAQLAAVTAQRDELAKWIEANGRYSTDWACAECNRYSPDIVQGFACAFHKAKNELIDERDAARRALADLVQAIKSSTLEGLCGLHRTEVFVAAEKAARGVS